MDKEKRISQHFFETGVLGAYETAEVDWEEEQDGKYAPCFDDALVIFGESQTTTNRIMYIEGMKYHISSVFPVGTLFTPTDKMLAFIDAEVEKDARND